MGFLPRIISDKEYLNNSNIINNNNENNLQLVIMLFSLNYFICKINY